MSEMEMYSKKTLAVVEYPAMSETTVYRKMGVAQEIKEIKGKLQPYTRKSFLIDPTRTEKISEMYQSKNFGTFYKKNFKKVAQANPLEDDARLQHATWQNTLLKTEARLNYIRASDNRRRIKIEKQWKDLEQKETELRKSFIMFNQFNLENAEKRQRAAKKIQDDTNLIKERSMGIEKLKEGIDEMKMLGAKMQEEIKKYQLHMEFLRDVTELSKEFQTSDSVIRRFLELLEAKIQLAKRTKEIFEVFEGAKDDLMKLIEEKNFIILGLNNQIANLQARYENANIKALESEGLVTEIKNNAVKQMGEIDAVKNSIWNIYTHMATSKKHKIKLKKERIEDQMMYINRTLTELVKVNKQIIAEQKKQQNVTAK